MSRRPLFPPVFAGNDSRPMLDDFTLRAQRLQSRSAPSLPMAQQVPLRSHPMWSGNNEFGFEAPFQPDATNRQMILKLGEFDYPKAWSVMLGADIPFTSTGTPLYNIVAEVAVGAGGIVDQFEVDWSPGVAFNVTGNTLIINARYESNSDIQAGIRLRALVGQGSIDGASPSRSFLLNQAIGVGDPFRMPRYARSMQALPASAFPSTGAYDALMLYHFMQSPTTGFVTTLTGVQLLALGAKVEIPGSTNFVRIDNLTAGIVPVSLRFGLGL